MTNFRGSSAYKIEQWFMGWQFLKLSYMADGTTLASRIGFVTEAFAFHLEIIIKNKSWQARFNSFALE